jgi:hypothetical protein
VGKKEARVRAKVEAPPACTDHKEDTKDNMSEWGHKLVRRDELFRRGDEKEASQ